MGKTLSDDGARKRRLLMAILALTGGIKGVATSSLLSKEKNRKRDMVVGGGAGALGGALMGAALATYGDDFSNLFRRRS